MFLYFKITRLEHPRINIGVLASPVIHFKLNGNHILKENGDLYNGSFSVSIQNNKILFDGNTHDSLTFSPLSYETASFDLNDVLIGIQFHWERKEDQKFKGDLHFIFEKENLRAINTLPVEDYLESVISSEMSANSHLQLLKAHAVISRSWLLFQLKKKSEIGKQRHHYQSTTISETEIIKWYDREDHVGFDVCADDHCQRYQGITKATSPNVRIAVQETFGEVLIYDNNICDARFSKCCGGITEEFENCWEPIHYNYLQSVVCNDLKIPVEPVEKRIMSNSPAFCNTQDKHILSQVLNNYDQETNDFYRWTIRYSQKELSALIAKKTGIDFGTIMDLVPVERGKSGRITKLLICGSKKKLYIGKELEIRKVLSETHTYSSAFIVKKSIINGIPEKFILHGAGWGHGVGLCQIGAAVMASKGYKYKEILNHYFQGSTTKELYQK